MIIQTTIEKVNEGIEELNANGGTAFFQNNRGSVSIQGVDAEFDFDDGILTINILDKPFLVSEEYVEDKIREYFA